MPVQTAEAAGHDSPILRSGALTAVADDCIAISVTDLPKIKDLINACLLPVIIVSADAQVEKSDRCEVSGMAPI